MQRANKLLYGSEIVWGIQYIYIYQIYFVVSVCLFMMMSGNMFATKSELRLALGIAIILHSILHRNKPRTWIRINNNGFKNKIEVDTNRKISFLPKRKKTSRFHIQGLIFATLILNSKKQISVLSNVLKPQTFS